MSAPPPRATPAGRAWAGLRALARAQGRPFDELLVLYGLEGFLARLAADPADVATFVLKGGVLLAAYGTRRPTRDADLLAADLRNDAETVRRRVAAIAARARDDGLELDGAPVRAAVIREDDDYSGVRATVVYRLATARISVPVDVSVGDPVQPAPQGVELPGLLGGRVVLRGYPLAAVLAEKLLTAVQRGAANTRWRDYADVYVITGRHRVDGADLAAAMAAVAAHRRVPPAPLAGLLGPYPPLAQARWATWRARQAHAGDLPAQFADVLAAAAGFADPVLATGTTPGTWDPARRRWT